MVFTAANAHIAEVFCIVQHADQCWCGECSCGNTGLGRGATCFCEPHERGVRCEVSTLNLQRSTAVDCGIISAGNRARSGDGELHVGRNCDCRGIAGVERMSVQFERDPTHHFRWGDGDAFRSIGKQCDRIVLHRRMANRVLHAHIGRIAHLGDRLRLICERYHGKQQRSR